MLSKMKLLAIALVMIVLILLAASANTKQTFWHNYHTGSGSTAGLQIETLRAGSGSRSVAKGDTVTVNYIGALEDGTTLESTYQTGGEPLTFEVGSASMIQGWNEGVIGMQVGEKRKLTVSPDLAYGSTGKANVPPDATLVFEIELMGIK